MKKGFECVTVELGKPEAIEARHYANVAAATAVHIADEIAHRMVSQGWSDRDGQITGAHNIAATLLLDWFTGKWKPGGEAGDLSQEITQVQVRATLQGLRRMAGRKTEPHEAADEIERLKSENADMRRTLDAPIPWLLERDLRAEIARLRAIRDGCERMLQERAAEIARLLRLRTAAERVCWYDWSSNNDADAVAAVEGLRRALEGK